MHTRTRKEEGMTVGCVKGTQKEEGMTVCCVNDNKMIDLCSGEK